MSFGFGLVIEGTDVLRKYESQETSRSDVPRLPCKTVNRGELLFHDIEYNCGTQLAGVFTPELFLIMYINYFVEYSLPIMHLRFIAAEKSSNANT